MTASSYRNWLYRVSKLRAVIRVPKGWSVTPLEVVINAPPKSEAAATFTVSIPEAEHRLNRRFVLTTDTWRDGNHLGEVTEGLVNMSSMKH